MGSDIQIIVGDCLDVLATLPENHFHLCVTSPPYFGMRDYGVDDAMGSELDLTDYLDNLVEVSMAIHRVLRPDGSFWLNIGDAYAHDGKWGEGGTPGQYERKGYPSWKLNGNKGRVERRLCRSGMKPKDLMQIPARLAIRLQDAGWWVRQRIVWCLSGGVWLYARTQKGTFPQMLKDLVRLDPNTVELWTGKRWTKVVKWTASDADRTDAVELVLRSGERISCTKEHLWPIYRKGNVRAEDLKVGDIVRTTSLPDGKLRPPWLTGDALWFAGLYLAEGSMSADTIQLAGHVKEKERWKRIQKLCQHYGASPRLYERDNAQLIHINQAGALRAVLDFLIAGKRAKGKHLSPQVWGLSNLSLELLIGGYLEGDGSPEGQRIRLGFTRNYALERDLRCAAARLGATLTLKPTFSSIDDRRYPSFRGEWRWTRSGHWGEKNRGEIVEIRRSRARQFWDVTVEDKSSLFALASGVLTHNCKLNGMPESAKDRPVTECEDIYMLTKSKDYYYDGEAVRQKSQAKYAHRRHNQDDGAALGNVWYMPVANYGGNHFATFPEELPRRCIAAGTAGDTCEKCGAPYRRVMSPHQGGTTGSAWSKRPEDTKVKQIRDTPKKYYRGKTLRWEPSCDCEPEGISQSRVLDPFGGAGTTGLVAQKMGRDATLIEINPEYAEDAKQRIDNDCPLFDARARLVG